MKYRETAPLWQTAVVVLAGTVVTVALVMGLQWGRPVLTPIAMAVLLSILVNPFVRALQRRGAGLTLAVFSVVAVAGIVVLASGFIVTHQLTVLVSELPQNTATIKAKVNTLRHLGSSPLADKFGRMFEEISKDVSLPADNEVRQLPSGENSSAMDTAVQAETVFVQTPPALWLGLTGYLSSAMEVLGTLALTLVLLVFFLLGRDELRDRMVMLAGSTRLAVTSKAMEDVTERVSCYITMVAMLNGGFGLLLATGLYALQVPYALLWGFISGMLRFIPYIGPWIGAVCPIAMAFATSAGWNQSLAVLAFVVVMELLSNNIIEPMAFGKSTGVSSTALFISAAFWMYLWGPIGLVLSAPFAVCLLVMGRNIPQLSFLNLLLGSDPALQAHTGIYQRLLLGDKHEAIRLIRERIRVFPFGNVFDEMLIPVLVVAKRDAQRERVSDADHQIILQAIGEILTETSKLRATAAAAIISEDSSSPALTVRSLPQAPARILGCPAADATDSAALEMLRQAMDAAEWDLQLVSEKTLSSELVAMVIKDPPGAVFIAALPPEGLAHARYLCKRLREASPGLLIIVGRFHQHRKIKLDRERLEEVGASFATNSLKDTLTLLESRLPLITRPPAA